jgi:membrane protein DedA with SNARE-associated domain
LAEAFLAWVSGLPPLAVYGVLAVLSAVENVFPPVPADVAVVFGAFLSGRGVVDAPTLGVLCWLANTSSSAALYFLARARGEAFFRAGWAARLVPPEAVLALREAFARHGVLGVFLSRFLPGVRAAVVPFAGVAGMPPARVLVPAALASAIWYAFLVAAGSAFALTFESARDLVDDLNRALGLLATLGVAAGAWWLWWRVRAARAGRGRRR